MTTTQSIYAAVTGHQDTYPHPAGDSTAYAPAPHAPATEVKPIKVSGYLAQSLRAQGHQVSASGKTGQKVLTLKSGDMAALVTELTARGYTILAAGNKTVTIR